MRGLAGWSALARGAPDEGTLAGMAQPLSRRNGAGGPLCGVIDRDARRHVALAASLFDAPSRVSLCLDGSILNAGELRSELTKKNYLFKSNSDEELLLRAYQHWDKDVVKHLRGAFALALWDARKDRLLLARDRFGEKPLHLYERPGAVFFASEPKALLAVPGFSARVDVRTWSECLARGYVAGSRTLFQGIRKLAPGSYATWQLGRLQEVRYWTPPDRYPLQKKESLGEKEATVHFVEQLQEAVRLRAGSVLLSGGLDSAAMVAVLAAGGRKVRTFTLGFEGDPASEFPAAAEVAKRFGTAHQEIVVAAKDLLPSLEKLVESRDAPVPRPSELAVHRLCAEAGRGERMLLSGDGGDEILGGYRRLLLRPYASWDMTRNRRERDRIFAAAGEAREGASPLPPGADPQASPLRRALYEAQTGRLPDELLERSDRCSALCGAELALPYLDHRLAEYVSSLPDESRVRGLATKWILRQAGKTLLPQELASRRKGGFRMPIRDWLRNELRATLLEHLQGVGSRTRKYYDAGRLDRMLDEHLRGKHDHARTLWTLLNLEIWHRRYAPA